MNIQIRQLVISQFTKMRAWGNGSVIKTTKCSCRGAEFSSQHLQQVELSQVPFQLQGSDTLASSVTEHMQIHIHMTYHTYATSCRYTYIYCSFMHVYTHMNTCTHIHMHTTQKHRHVHMGTLFSFLEFSWKPSQLCGSEDQQECLERLLSSLVTPFQNHYLGNPHFAWIL